MTTKKANWQKHSINIFHDCRDADVIICYPKKPTEFEIQAELYSRLEFMCDRLDNGTEVKSEVTVICDGNKSRFDLMVFRHNGSDIKAVCALEVKRGKWRENTEQHNKQETRYIQFQRITGIPVIYCEGTDEIEAALTNVEGHIA